MLSHVQRAASLNRDYLHGLIADIEPAEMTHQPAAGMNHPAWILAHLAATAGELVSLLGGQSPVPGDWSGRYGHGSKLSDNPDDYPDRQTLVKTYDAAHEAMLTAIGAATGEVLQRPTPIEDLRQMLPTLGDAVVFMATAHEATHLGQLSAWRRAAGRAPLF